MYTRIRLLFFLSVCVLKLAGQESAIELPEATVTSSFNRSPATASFVIKHKADSNYLYTGQASPLILQNDGLYLKSYNDGGLVTAGNRGFGASHTKVFWNGFLLNSPLNGTIDLNLVGIDPASTEVVFNKSNSPVEGNISGAGGSIWINDQIPGRHDQWLLAASAGSFGTFRSAAGYTFHKGRFASHLQLAALSTANDYTYHSVTDFRRPLLRLENADVRQYNISNASQIGLGSSRLDLRVNFNRTQRGIPPPITSTGPYSFQEDQAVRAGIAWSRSTGLYGEVAANAGFLYDELLYYPVRNENKPLSYYTTSLPVSARWNYERWMHRLNLHFNYARYLVNSTEIEAPAEDQLFGTAEIDRAGSGFIQYGGSFQQMLRNGVWIPASYRLYIGTKIVTGLKWTLAYANTSQSPTLNDRYWPLSGNPELKTEINRSWELGLNYHWQINGETDLAASLSLFNNSVDDWIAWMQVIGDFWKPFNVQKVRSKGLDLHIELQRQLTRTISFDLTYNLALADPRVVERYVSSPAVTGNRLIYVPLLQQSVALPVRISKHTVKPAFRYASSRYTTADNLDQYALPAYYLFDLEYNFRFRLKKVECNAVLKANNIFDHYYETIAFRPMPGRYFELGMGVRL